MAPGRPAEQIVDFNLPEFRSSYDRRPIPDQRALAHFHSNLGAEGLVRGDLATAGAHLAAAIDADPALGSAWVNLGVLFARRGEDLLAEAALLRALEQGATAGSAAANLANLHDRHGRADLARWFRSRAERHRRLNPWYWAARAEGALDQGDYGAARADARQAVRLRPDTAEFHALEGRAALGLGRAEEARQSFQAAARTAREPGEADAYRRQLDLLAVGVGIVP